jgi:hypothetical protein
MISYYAVKRITLPFLWFRNVCEFTEGRPRVIRIVEDVEVPLGSLAGILNDYTIRENLTHCAKRWQDSSGGEVVSKKKAPDD